MQDRLYIDGEWVRPEKGGTLDVIDPATEEVIHKAPGRHQRRYRQGRQSRPLSPSIPDLGRAYGNRARRLSPRHRREDRGKREFLARLEVADNGKPLPEADWDIDDAAGCFDYYAGLAEELDARPGRDDRRSVNRFHVARACANRSASSAPSFPGTIRC